MTKKTTMSKKVNKSKPTKQLTRKDLRKQKNQQKKETKRLFFSSKTNGRELVAEAAAKAQQQHTKQKKKSKKKKSKAKSSNKSPDELPTAKLLAGNVDSDEDESIASDFSDEEIDARLRTKEPSEKKVKLHTVQRPDLAVTRRRELQRQKDLENAARKQRIKQLHRENEDDDKLINSLEKKLKLNKTKDKNRLVRKMFNDGLDYALELCLDDEEERKKLELKEKRKTELQRKTEANEDELDWSDENEGLDDFGIGDLEGNDAEDDSEFGSDEADSDGEELAENNSNVDDPEPEPEYKEDIYGRKRDKHGNIIKDDTTITTESNPLKKYVPPHQRALLAVKSDDKQNELLERLRKNCKGQLNRLSEANLHKIATGIEDLYMRNSRFNMNETLTELLKNALIQRTLTNERMVQEHMVLLAYLHAQVGSEIGAHFLQMFVELFDGFLKEIDTVSVEDKRLNNLLLVLSYLYMFKIYEHRLLLEIVDRLTQNLCEKTVECLLLIFQSVGFKLRKDDPMAFKQMMNATQQRIAESPMELKDNLRLKFMIDILNAVKNNNINKIPQFDPELGENLRKRLKAMLRNDKYVVTLNITIDDLLRADSVGKWWIVGSAWSGNINDLGAATTSTNNNNTSTTTQRYSEKLMKLAKQQKMNTEERRNIFCIIMSAEDYVDAFEKIMHLSLKDQRGIAYVILHCALQERQVNPYYAHLALKFCNHNRKFQLAFQFASWDRINDIESLQKQQILNLAHFLQQLIRQGGLQLSILKVVDFLQLHKLSFLFMREIMKGILLGGEDNEVYQIFERVAKNAKLTQFKQSIRLFMQHFLLKEDGLAKLNLSEDQMKLLKKRVDFADKLLAYIDL